MKTHNINPHSGDNKPQFEQVHKRAMMGAVEMKKSPKRVKSAIVTKLENVQSRYMDHVKLNGPKEDLSKGIHTEKVPAPVRDPKDPQTRYPSPPRYSKMKNPLTVDQLDQ